MSNKVRNHYNCGPAKRKIMSGGPLSTMTSSSSCSLNIAGWKQAEIDHFKP